MIDKILFSVGMVGIAWILWRGSRELRFEMSHAWNRETSLSRRCICNAYQYYSVVAGEWIWFNTPFRCPLKK
jgi:hypothetical protein